MIIGVAGPSCGGKNIVCEYLENKGFINIDCDLLGHKALEEQKELLINRWGTEILKEGFINRKKIAEIVFSKTEELNFLEKVSHSWIFNKVILLIKDSTKDYLLNGAVLLESPLVNLCTTIFWVSAPRRIRLKRALKRDKISRSEIKKRFSNQKPLSSQLFFQDVDIYSIDNSRRPEYCYKQVDLALSLI